MKKTVLTLTLAALVSMLSLVPALAADWPSKPVTVIVPWAAGGMTDITTRLLVERFKDKLGQPVVVSNQGGASGITGMRAIMAAKPDGYTFGSGAIGQALGAPFFLDSPALDPKKLSYIGVYAFQERMLFIKPDSPYKTWPEFVAHAKKNPGQISIGFGGTQYPLEVVKSLAKREGLKLKLVMFKNGGEASTAMLGGHVDVVETGSGTPAYQAARQGKLMPLINLGQYSDPNFKDLKNVTQLGYTYSSSLDYGMVAPAGLPEPIRAKLEKALHDTLEEPAVQESLLGMGMNRKFVPGKEYGPIIDKAMADIPKLAEYVKDMQ